MGNRRGGRGRGRRYGRRSRSFYSAAIERIRLLDYKDIDTLRNFVTDRGKIRPRRQTNLNGKEQRLVARAVKRARHMALIPYAGSTNEE